MSNSVDVYREKAINLFKFLRDFTKLRSKVIRTVDSFDEVMWFDEIPSEPECYCVTMDPDGGSSQQGVWISVRKPTLSDHPAPPKRVIPWIMEDEIGNPTLDAPRLRERIVAPAKRSASGNADASLDIAMGEDDEPDVDTDAETRVGGDIGRPAEGEAEGPQFLSLSDCPDVVDSWTEYIEKKWKPWAQETLRRQKIQKLYSRLFSIYQKQRHMSERYETVVGIGYLTWHTPSDQVVERHLLTIRVLLSFDAEEGVIRVVTDPEAGGFVVEQEMLEPSERPDADARKAVEKMLDWEDEVLWDSERITGALNTWVHEASAEGVFEPELVRQTSAIQRPVVRLAPALILRRRLGRGLEEMYDQIVSQLESGAPIPPGVAMLIDMPDDGSESVMLASEASSRAGDAGQDDLVYFPLAANDAQRKIVERLSRSQGVLVQGPPGTGKSHTIANLIVHLIATGNRVLVTSHTSRALRVLKDKLPPEIASLCVLLIGESKDSMNELEASVQSIVEKCDAWDPEKAEKRIAELKLKLDEAKRDEARIVGQLVELRERETRSTVLPFGSYSGTAQAIAIQLSSQKESAWAAGLMEPDFHENPPLSNEEAVRTLELLRAIDDSRRQELLMDLPDVEALPTPDSFSNLARIESVALAEHEKMEAARTHPAYSALLNLTPERRDELIRILSDLMSHIAQSKRYPDDWVAIARSQVFLRQSEAWRELFRVTRESTEAILDLARTINGWQVKRPENEPIGALKAHAQLLLDYLESDAHKGFLARLVKPKPVREAQRVLEETYIDGRRCTDVPALQKLINWLDVMGTLEALDRSWSPYVTPQPASPSVWVARYRNLVPAFEVILHIDDGISLARSVISEIPGVEEPDWSDLDGLSALHDAAAAANAQHALSSALHPFDVLEAELTKVAKPNSPHPAVNAAIKAVAERNTEEYRRVYSELASLANDKALMADREELMNRLSGAAPALEKELRRDLHNHEWDKRLAAFTGAWDWARANTWIKKMTDPDYQKSLVLGLEQARDRKRKYLTDLASEKGWQYTLTRMTNRERQSLVAWSKEIRTIGKGTGKYADKHRATARRYMEECRTAIPAWIMPIYRVAESIRPGKDAFDVAIIDEASQSGPEALFLQYIAKKIVVVGDDKQISPEHVGVDRKNVDALRDEHLRGIPKPEMFGLDHSLFDLADIKYGSVIRLQEHFRCMPEIIQFCNKLSYPKQPLEPLRQYGAGRLTPVIETRYVAEGYVQGTRDKINPAEAQAIVDQIKRCCQDSRYDGKTMGVISLLSTSGQARKIESLLLQELGPEEMDKRRLICGDAYDFQGDERDVIFLSMVVAPNERFGVLSKETDRRRFNVAVSRARDQLWLFHSVGLSSLSPQDFRHELLSYCLDPSVKTTEVGGIDIAQLQAYARVANRRQERPPEPFDSWFEVDVFLRIAERGYRVIPQWERLGYRIDMVVEGLNGRIAVECDGDEWHGAEQYQRDMARQRELERCGYKFWRVYGSAFYRDPDEALGSLWSTLQKAGIYPSVSSKEREGVASEPRRSAGEAVSEEPKHPVEQTEMQRPGDQRSSALAEEADDADQRPGSREGKPRWKVRFIRRSRLNATEPGTTKVKAGAQPGETRANAAIGPDRHDVRFPRLNPYRGWREHPLPDPRTAKVAEVAAGLVEIVKAEGPVVCRRAYQLYNRAAGLARVGKELRRIYNRAMYSAIRSGKLVQSNDWGTSGQQDKIVRAPGVPAVVVRERGDRELDEIPPTEMAVVFRTIAEANGLKLVEDNKEVIFRLTLEFYGVKRLTKKTESILLVAWGKVGGGERFSVSDAGL